MAPDRPDASGVETACGLTVTRAYSIDDTVLTLKEADNASTFSDKTNTGAIDVAVPDAVNSPPVAKSPSEFASTITTKQNQSDDDLTNLAWLHQQNLLKGLEISSPTKSIKEENIINNNNNNNNNNICDDSTELSENTNSISSLDDNYFSESNGKIGSVVSGKTCQGYQSPGKNYEKSSGFFQDSGKIAYITTQQSNQVKISLNNNNLPVSNRNKHPTHIPYDPHLHRNTKPPYSFSCLIFMAIEDSPMKALPVKEVYAWILDHFPYFRNAPTGWKNSVRHNLSLNKCFRKVEKAPNLGKGSLWMVDDQYRPNLMQALSRAPFPPPTGQNLSSPEKIPKKNTNTRLPDPVLFPYLSKRLASSNITESPEQEFDSDVDAAAAAMLSFKHGPIILNHNKDRKRKCNIEQEKLVPVITRSSSEDHTYSCITSIKTEGSSSLTPDDTSTDADERRKIAEGADALLNLADVALSHNSTSCTHYTEDIKPNINELSTINHLPKLPTVQGTQSKSKRRTTPSDYASLPDKRRKRWREWSESNRYLKQIRG
ncbi:forkhead box protein N3-like isoform X2 [Chelonus insularis]|uniref:forkhead box protein N3-like isoform X2 n=1 Tax=Chelonus insularis TaxID=460826 RepID=UPI0015894FF7|nr:forkhead box protein N3-like isoform X2 [Chelonus insularis]